MSIVQGNTGLVTSDPLGQGRKRCRSIGLGTVKLFVDHLIERAKHGPLSADTLRDEYALFVMGDSQDADAFFDTASDGCSIVTTPLRRHQAFERALVCRLEPLFDGGPDERLSRRLIPGLFHAASRLLGADLYEEARAQSAVAAACHGESADLTDNQDLRRIIDHALINLALAFAVDFDRTLAAFLALVNSQLAAPTPGQWDATWQLDRRQATALLDRLYLGLRPDIPTDFCARLETLRVGLMPAAR